MGWCGRTFPAGALICAALSFALTGCGGTTSEAAGEHGPPRHGGNVVVGLEQEPAVLNTKHVQGGMAVTSWVTDPMLDEWIIVGDDNTYHPSLLTEVPTFETGHVKIVNGKMIVNADIQPAAHWSDGVPITCDDMKGTWKMLTDDDTLDLQRLGWDSIERIDCPTPKHMTLTFEHPYAPYLYHVFNTSPLPAHEFAGKNFNTFWNNRFTVTSGPFTFGYWKRNVEIQLKRDPNYWNKGNDDLPWLDTITYHFIHDTNTLKIQLRTGEVDYIAPPPDTSLPDELKTFPRSKFQIEPGSYWEQIALNNGKAPFNDVNVRRAVLYSIDRNQITDTVLKKQVKPLQSTQLPTVKGYYFPAWKQYTYNPDKVASYLKKAGYSRDGQYWKKNGKTLSVLFKSTAGNALRMKVSQLLQQQLKANGIKMDIQLEDSGVFFSQTTGQGSFDMGLWAWSSNLDPTHTSLFACDQIPTSANNHEGSNFYRYCNEEVSHKLHEADSVVETSVRARLIHETEQMMADDAALLPLYLRPETVAYSKRMQGVNSNPIGGAMWNSEEWSVR
jgi:peptide/nickel transport system substrate-binding protein